MLSSGLEIMYLGEYWVKCLRYALLVLSRHPWGCMYMYLSIGLSLSLTWISHAIQDGICNVLEMLRVKWLQSDGVISCNDFTTCLYSTSAHEMKCYHSMNIYFARLGIPEPRSWLVSIQMVTGDLRQCCENNTGVHIAYDLYMDLSSSLLLCTTIYIGW